MTAPLLAVVPARGGSKSIPRKALQQVGGVPMLLRTLRTVEAARVGAALVVSTDDPEIASLTRLWGYEVLLRHAADLSADETPLIEVARHAVEACGWAGDVALFQPTCPLFTAATCRQVVERWQSSGAEWAITASKDPHLFWQRGEPAVPRINRQLLLGRDDCMVRESGAAQFFTQAGLADGMIDSRPSIATLLIPPEEALDIDTWDDLLVARRALQRRNILFRIVVGNDVGSGHLYRAIRLAEALHPHHVGISPDNSERSGTYPVWALEMLDQRGLWWEGVESSFLEKTDLVVLDTLDTTVAQVARWKKENVPVVTFEDQGRGAKYADLVVNELLAPIAIEEYLYGPRYAVLRNEFAAAPDHEPEPDRILVTFGGTDPARLNARVSQSLAGYDVRVMLGPGCDPSGVKGTVVVSGSMAEEMHYAALVITGQGRTQYEAAAMGAPALLIAANERESRHFVCPGHLALGLHALVPEHFVAESVHRLMGDKPLLAEMGSTARKAVDGRGVERIVRRFDALLEEES